MGEEKKEFEFESTGGDKKGKKAIPPKWAIGVGAAGAVLLIGYIVGVVYFQNRFLFNTTINGEDFSQQEAVVAREFVENQANDFYITINGENGSAENIYAADIGLEFIASGAIENLLEEQNPFAWPLSLMREQEIDVSVDIVFEQALLDTRIASLDVVTGGQTDAVPATVVIENNEAILHPHEYGNVVDVELLQEVLEAYISMLSNEFTATDADIFFLPEFLSDSPEVVEAFENANRYLDAEITYLVGREVVVDRELIAQWVTIDDEFNVTLDEELVNAWLVEFIGTVNTGAFERYSPISAGATRTFISPVDGREITVSGGFFGWIVNSGEEFTTLLGNIRNGEVISREPIYWQRGITHGAHDWGDTFIQIDLTNQHMWAIFDGVVRLDSPVVTGYPGWREHIPQGTPTTQGVFSILEMLPGTNLVAPWLDDDDEPIYDIPVDYWMRYTWSGYGLHDMVRQPRFGGTQYRSTGSHGCTNLPLAAARELYGMIFIGMPVVVHH
ncbi:MAG: L,D-transpeptidase [Turicibacter sp.]|nr:L,D-transpeptidase [Turicibacter sp.]